jgi:ATP-binding cassette subfamily C protein CydC
MKPLLRIMALSRRQAPWLALGLVVTLLGTLAGLALSGAAGAVFAGASLLSIPLLLRSLGPIRVLLRYFERLTTHNALFRALADLRIWFFHGLAVRMAGGLGMQRSGDVLARLVGDVEAQDVLYMRVMLPLIGAVVVLPILLVLLAGLDIWLAAIVASLFVMATFVLPWIAARNAHANGALLARSMADLRIAVLDSIAGLREVRAFAAEGRMLASVQAREAGLLSAQRNAMRQMARAGAAAFVCSQAAILATLVIGRTHGIAAIALVFIVLAGFEAIALLPRAGAQAGLAAAAAARVLEVAQGPIPLPDAPITAAMPTGNALRVEGINFKWDAGRQEVFNGLSLEIPAGHRVALLGPSGSGKSSLAALLLRLAAPQSGRILLGGIDIATLAATELRSRIGWLSQSTHLFDDTIRANLLLARPDATDDQLWTSLEHARIADAVRALPEGLDFYLGEGGQQFSGGQGRRLALARALLSPARILILDEPCAGLDVDTERAFLTTLNDIADTRSIILIAHRLTGVERLDRIFRISNGRAVAAAA